MHKLLLFASLLLISNCGRETKDKWYIPKLDFKRTKNPNYKHYFPQAVLPKQKEGVENTNDTIPPFEPIPSLSNKPLRNESIKKEKTAGIFDFLFGSTNPEKENYSNEAICEELLDINKLMLIEQNRKLELLTDEKKRFIDQINNLELKFQRLKNQDQDTQKSLENEIDRLNRLIKILSSEIN